MDAQGNGWVQVAALIVSAITTLGLPYVYYKIRQLEKNTNSIKDALIKTTAEAEHAKGKLQGKAEQKAETNREKQG